MAYIAVNEPRCKTREPIGWEGIGIPIVGIGSPAFEVVDTWTGSKVIARVVAAPGLSGYIRGETIRFWDDLLGEYVMSPPEVPLGSMIGFSVAVENTSPVTVYTSMYSWVRYPGESRSKHYADATKLISPSGGAILETTFPAPELYGGGNYTLEEIYLEFEAA